MLTLLLLWEIHRRCSKCFVTCGFYGKKSMLISMDTKVVISCTYSTITWGITRKPNDHVVCGAILHEFGCPAVTQCSHKRPNLAFFIYFGCNLFWHLNVINWSFYMIRKVYHIDTLTSHMTYTKCYIMWSPSTIA